ncbi:hypothetical protein GJAV_G00105040 [Gymnothorax javanicus]|nr:hypothetical protein GJAV_G00105040 [Gymnothorax javanicus]
MCSVNSIGSKRLQQPNILIPAPTISGGILRLLLEAIVRPSCSQFDLPPFHGKMKKEVFLTLILCYFHAASAASHSMKYFYTAVTSGIDFPEFTIVALVDEEQFLHYDSNIKKIIPKTEWFVKAVDEQYWDRNLQYFTGTQPVFKANIGILMQRFNQTQGVRTYQWMYSCEWDDETGATGGVEQYGYDGEDFISLDLKNLRFIGPTPQAFITAVKWNNNLARLEYKKQYFTQECVEWLKKYVSYGRSSLERTVPPQVSLLQKDPSSPVTCHVTGFRPRGVMVTWQKNGQELDVDVELGETVPNGDGTFQTRSHLRVKPEDLKRDRYTCTVQHKSLEQDIILTVGEVRTINPDGSGSSTGIIIGCVVGALILLAAIIGVVMWKKRSSGYGKTSTTDTDSANSDPPAVRT